MDTKYFTDFFNILVNDCSEGAKVWVEQSTDASKRAYIRTVFSFIEGNSYRMKQLWLDCHNKGVIQLDVRQLIDINEVKIDKNGKAKVSKLSFKESIKSSFSIPSKKFNINNPLKTNGNDWSNFNEALKIRHRLTHPKTVEDLDVTDQDMLIIENACEFYREATMELFRRM